MALFSLSSQVLWQFETNLKPLPEAKVDAKTWEWWHDPAQREAFDYMMRDPRYPEKVFKDLSEQLIPLKRCYKIIVVCWPSSFDWPFIQYYMHKYVGDNVLGRVAKCGASYAWSMAKTNNPNISINPLLDEWADKRFKHTHRALDDALEQGARFVNMIKENTRNGKDKRLSQTKE